MQCDQLQQHLDALLDRREVLSADRELAAHLAVCHTCRPLAGAYEAMLLGVELLGEVEPDLSAACDATRIATARPAKRYALAAALVVAASLMFAVVYWQSPSQTQPSASVVAKGDSPPSQLDQPDPSQLNQQRPTQPKPSPPPSLLPSELTREDIERACIVTGQGIAYLPQKLPQTVRVVAAHPETDRIVGHIRPFTDPFGATWDVLRRAWPGSGLPSTAIPESDTSLVRWRNARYA